MAELLQAYQGREEASHGAHPTGLFVEPGSYRGDVPFHYPELVDWSYNRPRGATTTADLMAIEADTLLPERERALLEGSVARRLAMDSLLRQASRFDHPGDEEVMRRRGVEFMRHTVEFYGAPDPALFWQAYGQRTAWLRDVDPREGSIAAAARDVLLGNDDFHGLLPVRQEAGELYLPPQVAVERAHEWVMREFGDVLALVDTERTDVYSPQEMVDAFNAAFALRGMDKAGWRSILEDRKGGGIRTDAQGKIIAVPMDRTPLKPDVAQKKLGHEFTHAWRGYQGGLSGVVLANTGMPGYGEFEETFCKAIEVAIAGKIDPEKISGIEDYLAIGLTMGIDGRPRTAPEIYDIFYAIGLSRSKPGGDVDETIQTARNFARARIANVFRGTPGDLPGVCLTRNQAYFQSYEPLWRAIDATPDIDALMNYFMRGKFNPFDPVHQAVEGRMPAGVA